MPTDRTTGKAGTAAPPSAARLGPAGLWLQAAILYQAFWLFSDGQVFDIGGIVDASDVLLVRAGTELLQHLYLWWLLSGSQSGDWLATDWSAMAEPAFVVFVLYLGPLAIALARRDWWALLAGLVIGHAAAAGIALMLLGEISTLGNPALGAGQVSGTVVALLDVGAKITFLWVLVRGLILSRAYLAVVLLTFLLFSGFGGGADWSFWRGLLPALTAHLTFVLTVAGLRMGWRLIVDNLELVRSLGIRQTARLGFRATLLWAPILLVAVPYFWAQWEVDRAITEAAYRHPLMPKLETCAPQSSLVARRRAEIPPEEDCRRELEADALVAVDRFYDARLAEWRAQMDARRRQLDGLRPDRFAETVLADYDGTIDRRIYLDRPGYGGFWGPLKNVSADISAGMIEGAYYKVNERTRGRIYVKAQAQEADLIRTQGDVRAAMEELDRDVTGWLEDARTETKQSLRTAFFAGRTFDRLTMILFILLCVKSFAYVFARVACARDTEGHVSLGASDGAMPRGTVTAAGSKLTLPRSEGRVWFICRRFQPHGKAPKWAIPQRGSAALARIRHRAYAMNRFEIDPDRGPIHVTATRGAEFTVWALKPGETVVFDYRYFVGMSDEVTLGATISARLTTQIFGRFIFPTATGPGRIIFMTEGAPQIANARTRIVSMPPSRLVAWHRTARFHIDSELSLADIYFSEAYVEPVAKAPLILDVDRQEGFGRGLTRFLRNFLMPV